MVNIKEVDLVVVGSGAGGMMAALTAHAENKKVLLIEKSVHYGGSTALSGGAIWIPNNPTLLRARVRDKQEDVLAYLSSITHGKIPQKRLQAFIEAGPHAIKFLEESCRYFQFQYIEGYPDYHPEVPGGRAEGRSIEALPIDLNLLGENKQWMNPSIIPMPPYVWLTIKEYKHLNLSFRSWKGAFFSLKLGCRSIFSMMLRRQMGSLGQALVARFRLALQETGVEIWMSTSLKELIKKNNAVIGALVERKGETIRVHSKQGVILACGGFEHNLTMRKQYFSHLSNYWSTGSKNNTGDGIQAALRQGAKIEAMDSAWWMPSIQLPSGCIFPLVAERAIPRSLIINGFGVRFANEAAPYVNFVHHQLALHQKMGKHIPAFFIMDSVAKRRYLFAGITPLQSFPKEWFKTKLAFQASSLPELADQIAVSRDNLVETVARFNRFALQGKDEDFKRGESVYDCYYGDPSLKNSCLDQISQPPYFAISIVPGDLGTNGGLVCDENSVVLAQDDSPIQGLYATGNCSRSVMGDDYAGAGATIGPAIVFGWIAARHACARAMAP
ncbi:MAG: FAD-binding protein [Verrucomicrobia bacterium]|nr:FAD-binding protein [Verrucomicrobiota bacterium]